MTNWIKSDHSPNAANCVELKPLDDGGVAFRNSRDPEGPQLHFTASEFDAFIAGAKDGNFDHLM